MLVRVVAPHFVAGIEYDTENDTVTLTAPILKYMRGWPRDKVRAYCESKSWTAKVVSR